MCVCDKKKERKKERESGQNQFVLSRDVIGVYSDTYVTVIYSFLCVLMFIVCV